MIIFLGLVVLLAAVIVAVAGVLGNAGSAHALNGDFSVFGYYVTGSTGTLFLYGLVVGAAGMAGLGLLLAGVQRNARRARVARLELRRTREAAAAPDDVRTVPAATTRHRTWRHPFGGHPTAAPH